MAVVLLSSDLMGGSRVESAARRLGVDLRIVGNIDAALDYCAVQRVPLVIVDLGTAGLDLSSLITRLKSGPEHGPATVAFGPHVHEETLDAAKAAGCDLVLSRGQFMSQADTILALYGGTDPRADD